MRCRTPHQLGPFAAACSSFRPRSWWCSQQPGAGFGSMLPRARRRIWPHGENAHGRPAARRIVRHNPIGGFPFRIEVHCGGASLQLKGAPPLPPHLPLAEVAVQVYDPKLVISEFTAPLQISEPGLPPALVVQWNIAQGSMRGLPSGAERASLVLAGASVRVPSLAGNDPVLGAARLEVH